MSSKCIHFLIEPFSFFPKMLKYFFLQYQLQNPVDRSTTVAEGSEEDCWVCSLILKVEGLCQSPLWLPSCKVVIMSLSAPLHQETSVPSKKSTGMEIRRWESWLVSQCHLTTSWPHRHPLRYHSAWASGPKEKKMHGQVWGASSESVWNHTLVWIAGV